MYKPERAGAGRRVAMNTAVNAEYEGELKMDYMKEAKEMARKLAINYLEVTCDNTLIQFSGYTRETGLWCSVAERRIAAV